MVLRHPLVGRLKLHREKMPIGDVILVMYYPGEDAESVERLATLGALAATPG